MRKLHTMQIVTGTYIVAFLYAIYCGTIYCYTPTVMIPVCSPLWVLLISYLCILLSFLQGNKMRMEELKESLSLERHFKAS